LLTQNTFIPVFPHEKKTTNHSSFWLIILFLQCDFIKMEMMDTKLLCFDTNMMLNMPKVLKLKKKLPNIPCSKYVPGNYRNVFFWYFIIKDRNSHKFYWKTYEWLGSICNVPTITDYKIENIIQQKSCASGYFTPFLLTKITHVK
jgi:hypothetical protein